MEVKDKVRNELEVVIEAKKCCTYIFLITGKAPKHFRYTFISKMQNLSISIIECIYRANDVYLFVGERDVQLQKRLDYQHQALTELKLLSYFSFLALENKCILLKQYKIIAENNTKTQNMIGAWIKSDKRRFK